MILFVFLAAVAIFIIEGLPLIKRKQRKKMFALGVLLIIALFLVIGDKFGVPSPIGLIKDVLDPIGKDLFT